MLTIAWNRDSPGTNLAEESDQGFTDLPQQQNRTGVIVDEKGPTTVAEEKSTTDTRTTNGTQSTDELEAIAPLGNQQRSSDVAEPPETASETQNATVTETAKSENSTYLNTNSTMQLEELTGTDSNAVEEVVGEGFDSKKQSSVIENITNSDSQQQRRRKSSGATQFSDEFQLLENVGGSKVGERISFALEDGRRAEAADAEDDEAGIKTDVERGANKEEAEDKACDFTAGTWVLDQTRPLYSGRECTKWLSPDWACRLHDHPDEQMDRYRWQPAGCNLPVFNASAALET